MISLLLPVPAGAPITQTFAEHVARRKANGWKYYNGGIDYAVREGTPIVAAADGMITAAKMDATGYGRHVRIQHADKYLTLYGHLSEYAVGLGARVKAGDVIGYSGNTGNSSGPHTHFELRHNGTPIDPQSLIADAEPEQPEQPTPTDIMAGIPMRVLVDGLNVRTEPSTAGTIVGQLNTGDNVTVMKAWAQTERGWVAMIWKGEIWVAEE